MLVRLVGGLTLKASWAERNNPSQQYFSRDIVPRIQLVEVVRAVGVLTVVARRYSYRIYATQTSSYKSICRVTTRRHRVSGCPRRTSNRRTYPQQKN
jgi:hypothetical protein